MTALIRYEAARSALAAAHQVDEVKDMRDKAEAMAAYARQAKDTELIQYATEIKVRAERRCGELLSSAAASGGRATREHHGRGGQVEACDQPPTLADMGLTKDQSSRYQQLAAMPADHFETAVATAKATAGEVTTAFMLREARAVRPIPRPMVGKKADLIRAELAAIDARRRVSELCADARRRLAKVAAQPTFNDDERRAIDELSAAIQACEARLGSAVKARA